MCLIWKQHLITAPSSIIHGTSLGIQRRDRRRPTSPSIAAECPRLRSKHFKVKRTKQGTPLRFRDVNRLRDLKRACTENITQATPGHLGCQLPLDDERVGRSQSGARGSPGLNNMRVAKISECETTESLTSVFAAAPDASATISSLVWDSKPPSDSALAHRRAR